MSTFDPPPSSSRDPQPPRSEQDPAKEVAKGAALGCLAGLGAIGTVIITIAAVLVTLAVVGMGLLYLACSGH